LNDSNGGFAAYHREDSSKPSEYKYNSKAIDANDRFVGYALASQTKNNITQAQNELNFINDKPDVIKCLY